MLSTSHRPTIAVHIAPASAPDRSLPPEIHTELTKLDDKMIGVVEQGDIRFVRSSWLLDQPDGFRMPNRQKLEALEEQGVSPSPLLSPHEAVDLVRRGDRSAGALTYGWPSPGVARKVGPLRRCWRPS